MPRYQSVNSVETSPSTCTRLAQEPSQTPTIRAGDSATFIKEMQKQSKDPLSSIPYFSELKMPGQFLSQGSNKTINFLDHMIHDLKIHQ